MPPKIEPFGLTVNDLQPYYRFTAKDADGNAIDLTGATIYCTMKNMATGAVKINRQTTGIVIDPDQVTNKGQAEYRWQVSDTDTACSEDTNGAYPGHEGFIPYYIEFEVNPQSGGKFTYPNRMKQGPAAVVIYPGLDSA